MQPLFTEWVKSLEESILRVVKDKGSISPGELAAALGISEKSAVMVICGMVEKGTLKFTGIEASQ